MTSQAIKKHIIEVIFGLYTLIAFILYFYMQNLTHNELLNIQNFIKNHHFWGGGYTYLAIEYSKLLNLILSIMTIFSIIALFKFRNSRTHARNINKTSHYVFTILFIPITFYFLWFKEWKLFSSNDGNHIKEITTYILIICSFQALFISEFWYFIDILEKIYKKIMNKQDE